jgi:hypothetical protein
MADIPVRERAGLRIETLRTTARLAPVIWKDSARIRYKFTGQMRDKRAGWGTHQWAQSIGIYEYPLRQQPGSRRRSGPGGQEKLMLRRP